MLNDKILGGKQFGKIAFDLLINHAFLSTDTSIKGGPHRGDHPVPVHELVLIDQSFII
jgi:hypothetical protein